MLNKKIGVSLALLIAVTFFAAFNAREKNAQREAVLMRSLLSSLSTFHIKPLNIDDQFSEKLYNLYLNRIHGSKSWLTQEDLDVLETYKWRLDDEANEGSFAFLDQVIKLEQKALRKTKKYYLELHSKPFDFTRNEDYDTDQKKRPYAKNDEALKEYWRQDLKWETLTRLSDKITKKENNEEGYRSRSTAQLEEEARNEVLHRYNDLFSGYEAYTRTETLSEYLRALTNIFDPHSDYLEPAEKPADDAAQTKRLEGIGASLTTRGGFIVVDEISFGGPAWKQGILQVNDRIEKVAQGDRGKWTAVAGMSADEVVQLIQGKPGLKVRLVIRKPDGSSLEIALMRDVVIVEEDLAKSLLLETGNQELIGLIHLPDFYGDYDHDNGVHCADDVAMEIEKLRKEGVKGLIIDLRDNGGGNVGEAIKMTGLFIGEGPVMQTLERERYAFRPDGPPVLIGGKPEVNSDEDPRVLYDGPLIILVNKFTASAAENVAAALQDYGRAIIVGEGNATWGKGCASSDFDLDRSPIVKPKFMPLGTVTVTTSLIYRVTGGSYHLQGVVPDVALPATNAYLGLGEKQYDFTLPWTEIEPVPFGQKVYDLKNLKEIQSLSAERVKHNHVFSEIDRYAAFLKKLRDESICTLNLDGYRQYLSELEAEKKPFDNLFTNSSMNRVRNLTADMPSLEEDENKKSRNAEWVNNVAGDIYLMETLNIMQDLLGGSN